MLQLLPKLEEGDFLLCTGEGKQPQVLPHDVIAAAALVRGRKHAHELYSAWDLRATICRRGIAGLTRMIDKCASMLIMHVVARLERSLPV